MINSIESKLDEYNAKSNFKNINMIPKAIGLLITKEKKYIRIFKNKYFNNIIINFF